MSGKGCQGGAAGQQAHCTSGEVEQTPPSSAGTSHSRATISGTRVKAWPVYRFKDTGQQVGHCRAHQTASRHVRHSPGTRRVHAGRRGSANIVKHVVQRTPGQGWIPSQPCIAENLGTVAILRCRCIGYVVDGRAEVRADHREQVAQIAATWFQRPQRVHAVGNSVIRQRHPCLQPLLGAHSRHRYEPWPRADRARALFTDEDAERMPGSRLAKT